MVFARQEILVSSLFLPCFSFFFCEPSLFELISPAFPSTVGDLLNFIQDNLALVISAAALFGLTLLGFLFWGCRKANRKDAKLGKSLVDLRGRLTVRRKNNNNNNGGRNPNPRASAAGPGPRAGAPGTPVPVQNARASAAGQPRPHSPSQQGRPASPANGRPNSTAQGRPNSTAQQQGRPRSQLQSESNNSSGRVSMSGDFVGAGNAALLAPSTSDHPPQYSEVAVSFFIPFF